MVVRSISDVRRGALSPDDGDTLAEAATAAADAADPLRARAVLERRRRVRRAWPRCTAGDGRPGPWPSCSGVVPVVVVVTGPALSGPALLLGLADLVVMTGDAFAFVSGPAMVEEFTGIRIGVHQLGG